MVPRAWMGIVVWMGTCGMMMMMMHREEKGQASSRKQRPSLASSRSHAGQHSRTSCGESGHSNSSSTSSSSTASCPSLLTILAWTATLLLVSSCLGIADAGVLMGHPLGKRSYLDISCKGVYDKSIFARLDRICEDCYNLFREPQLHVLCRKNCFTTDYFKGCLDVLLLTDEMEKIQMWIKQLHGADPGV
ncbi:hypothetical protein KPH14_001723 [Odynerus spinipes]|uniref:Ion transport peptide-like n=1 Tax=Odynerus spinipes TaxID=1348599 RepID=A0AAD9RZK6_9HYME|nr:hypothetical protein KPH14_001723 [Odynerus spinipes]